MFHILVIDRDYTGHPNNNNNNLQVLGTYHIIGTC